ncbi:MAG: hypothetical protein ACK4Z6_04010, partial [Candidatus Methylomirabilales bacterium]
MVEPISSLRHLASDIRHPASKKMRISPREKRFLIAGGLAVGAFLITVYVLEPFISSQRKIREEIREKKVLLERHQRLASEKDRYQRKVNELKAQLQQAEGVLLKGEKLPLVAAELQGLLHKLGQEAGLTIVRENVP